MKIKEFRYFSIGEGQIEESSKGEKHPLELTPGHLLGIPFHLSLQKRLRVNRSMRLPVEEIYETPPLVRNSLLNSYLEVNNNLQKASLTLSPPF
jgi:hypothetical protein